MPVLQVSNLTKVFRPSLWSFKNKQNYNAVDAISFELKRGEILGLLGPNGAGKTTTIQMLLGTMTPSSGLISYFGSNFAEHRIYALKKIGYASGYDKLPARLTVLENLDIVARIYKISEPERSQRIEELLKFFGVWEKRNHETGTLSAGQMTRVMLAKAFIANPDIVLLDEPTASLDPDSAREVRQFILAQQKERAISLIITSHNMSEVTELCDRVLVLKQGKIIADSTPELLAQSTSKARVNLIISKNLDRALACLQEKQLFYTLHAQNQLVIELEEQEIAQFLSDIAKRDILYSQISIDKPTLEDYFLSIAKAGA